MNENGYTENGMAWGQENDIKMDDGRGMRADG